jgi:hypothetical protein
VVDIARVHASIGYLLKALLPEKFAAMKARGDEFVAVGLLTKESEYDCYTLVVRVSNDPVSAHKNPGDARGVLAAGTRYGKFTGADFCILALGISFRELL